MLAQAHTTSAVWWSHRAQEMQGSLPPDWSRQRVPPFFAEASGLYSARMRVIRVSVLMMLDVKVESEGEGSTKAR